MKRKAQIIVGAGCVVLLIISWVIAISSKTTAEKQLDLIHQAAELASDGIYVLAVPLLEEAAGYNAVHTSAAETDLKRAYLALIDTRGYSRKYTGLLERQMSRKGAQPDVFVEAANYYLGISRTQEALVVLKDGIEKTGSEKLIELYESNRYTYETNRTTYELVAAMYNSTVQVRTDGLWGLARTDGSELIPCEYEKISTFSVDRAIVRKNGEVFAVNSGNNRVAKLHENAIDFGNYANDRVPLLIDGSWRRANGDFTIGASTFQQLGMYSGGYAAAKEGGYWGVIDTASKWLIPAEYDEIIQDELGRCYARGAVFAQKGGAVYLFVEGQQVGEAYEDARPFTDEGYAAVMRNGKWGFIDLTGAEMVRFIFDDALSYGQHLAAVKTDSLWGYINLTGQVVIEPVFIEAKSFSQGSAPVLTERGWQFITLLEYKKGASL